uniref:DUF6090 family protein n=1 Tax=uncultured Polaribacter sp. TaxID=174711 RepID=UPI0026213715|nr:DUF6090 family protein [uncultured Polaribacter sp.]
MIKLFKNLRRKLLNENRFNKYLIYAIGEIVLVVIGILIALQINNWNENRKEKSEVSSVLKNLYDEFTANKTLIKTTKLETASVKKVGLDLMQLFGKSKEEIITKNPDSLLYLVLEPGDFRASENTINDLVQSGRLKLLSNKKLKEQLYKWQSTLKDFDAGYNRIEIKIDEDILPYLSKNYALKDIDKYGDLKWKKPSNLKVDKFKIFSDIEFENILDDYLYRISTTQITIDDLEKIIDNILIETNQ